MYWNSVIRNNFLQFAVSGCSFIWNADGQNVLWTQVCRINTDPVNIQLTRPELFAPSFLDISIKPSTLRPRRWEKKKHPLFHPIQPTTMKRNFRVEIQENYLPCKGNPDATSWQTSWKGEAGHSEDEGKEFVPHSASAGPVWSQDSGALAGFDLGWLSSPIHTCYSPPAMHAHTNFTLQGPTQPWIISSRPSGTCSTASLSTTRTLAAASRLYTTSCSLPPNVGLCVCVCLWVMLILETTL